MVALKGHWSSFKEIWGSFKGSSKPTIIPIVAITTSDHAKNGCDLEAQSPSCMWCLMDVDAQGVSGDTPWESKTILETASSPRTIWESHLDMKPKLSVSGGCCFRNVVWKSRIRSED